MSLNNKVCILCPGQGAQPVEMRKRWGNTRELGEVLEVVQNVGISTKEIRDVLDERSPEKQRNTRRSQLALWIEQAIYHRTLSSSEKLYCAVAGHSVGEVYALYLAGVLSEIDSLRVLDMRSRLMEKSVSETSGCMVAVLGFDLKGVEHELLRYRQGDAWISSVNSSQQIVLGGSDSSISSIKKYFSSLDGVYCYPLRTGGAFHTPLMTSARKKFADFLSEIKFNDPLVGMPSNLDGLPHQGGEWRNILSEQITEPVRWDLCMKYLKRLDVNYVELSEKRILSRLLQYN